MDKNFPHPLFFLCLVLLNACAHVLDQALVPPISVTATQASGGFAWNPGGTSQLTFAGTSIGLSRPVILELVNGSDYAVQITSTTYSSGQSFTNQPIPAIPAHGSELLTVQFQPNQVANLEDTLDVEYSNSIGNFSLSISLTGQGLSPSDYDCAASPDAPVGHLFPAGNGTPAAPYVICTPAQLSQIGTTASLLSASYQLGADLDFSAYDGTSPETTLTPIGAFNPQTTTGLPFAGSFDGRGHTISNWSQTVTSTSSGGLFAYTSGATIQNVNLSSFTVSGASYVGGLVGYAVNSVVMDSSVQGTFTGSGNYVGGLIGYLYANGTNEASSLSGDSANVSSTAASNVGGLVGELRADPGATISVASSTSQGSVTANGGPTSENAGGLISEIQVNSSTSSVTISSSSSSTTVLGRDALGGFIGTAKTTAGTLEITGNHASGSVGNLTGSYGNSIGGFIGYLNPTNSTSLTLSQDYSTGDVTSPGSFSAAFLGNFVSTASTIIVSDSYSTGNFFDTGATDTYFSNGVFNGQAGGGFIGSANMTTSQVTIERCSYSGLIDYSTNPYTPANLGGLIGSLKNTSGSVAISNSYTVASIKLGNLANSTIGGLIGGAGAISGVTSTITNTYASTTFSQITHAVKVGAFVGINQFTFSGSYFNSDLYSTGVGSGVSTGLTSETTNQLETLGTFSGWDFSSTWSMPIGGMPVLQ